MPYYLRWIAEFNVFCRENGRSDADGVASFVASLIIRYPQQHVAEAKRAVTLYKAFCGRQVPDFEVPAFRSEIPGD